MKMFRAVFVALALLTTSALAEAKFKVDAKGVLTSFPACSVPGKQVVYIRTNAAFLNQNGTGIAMARRNWKTGQPGIYFDVAAFQKFTPEFQTWVLAHECAHWSLGHMDVGYAPGTSMEYTERDADCHAASILVNMGFSDEQLKSVVDDIADEELMQSAGYAIVPKHISPQVRAYSATTDRRARHVFNCIDEARRDNAKNLR